MQLYTYRFLSSSTQSDNAIAIAIFRLSISAIPRPLPAYSLPSCTKFGEDIGPNRRFTEVFFLYLRCVAVFLNEGD